MRERRFERITGCIPCHYCVNCGMYTDAVIRKNKAMSPKELENIRLNDTEYPLTFQCVRSA